MLEKLVKFIGRSVRNLVEREDECYCFRLHRNRVYYVREALVKKATNVRAETRLARGLRCGNETHFNCLAWWLRAILLSCTDNARWPAFRRCSNDAHCIDCVRRWQETSLPCWACSLDA